jgi:sugar lactone lactonase YvrE
LRRATAVSLSLAAALLAGAMAPAALPAGGGEPPARWTTHLLALIPKPGFPAHAYVHPNGRIYEGTYVNPSGDSMRSRVFEYTGRGTLLRSWTVPGQDLAAEHGVQVATSDARGRLVLLDRTPARALLLNRNSGGFRRYATFRDLPPCGSGAPATACSPALGDDPAVPNYAAWGPDGRLYVTDYLQAVIWRVPPGGGPARVWLADRRLDGNMFGTTGIELADDRRTLLVTQQSSAGLGGGNPATGKLFAVRIRNDGRAGALEELWESDPLDGPDGFAIARSGNVYVALVGSNQIARLAPDGDELERFPEQPATGENGSRVPFDNPSNASFLGRRLIVANQSFISGDPAHQALLSVQARERGLRELIPANAGVRRR